MKSRKSIRYYFPLVVYTAENNSEYRIDLTDMTQVNMATGTIRRIHRRVNNTTIRTPIIWQYEGDRIQSEHRVSIPLVQYPKEIALALERTFREVLGANYGIGYEPVAYTRSSAIWRIRLSKAPKYYMQLLLFHCASAPMAPHRLRRGRWPRQQGDELGALSLVVEARLSEGLREALFEMVLCQHDWYPYLIEQALWWLVERGLILTPNHVRKIALLHGGITPLRIAFEHQVDMRGVTLITDHYLWRRTTLLGSKASPGGWVQRCKPAIKALLGRGALLGDSSSQSESQLLSKIEEEGGVLWTKRVLMGLRRERPSIPEVVMGRIATFCYR